MKAAPVRSLGIVPAIILSMGAAGGAHAAGFQLLEQSASGLGNAYAGSAAIAQDASTIFYNPAGMIKLDGINVSGGVNAIRPSFKFGNDGSTGPGGLWPVGTNTGGDAGSWGLVPNLYGSWRINPDWAVGLGIGAPFGLMTEYDDDWIGRFHSTKFSIESININPSVAYRVSDRLSIGAGLNWMHLDADYRRAAMLGPMGPEGRAGVKMNGDGWGWNVGMLYDITPDTRIGLSYRSAVKMDVDGDTKVYGPGPVGVLMRADAETSVKLPDTATLSFTHNLNDRWQLLADVSWTGWSKIESLDIYNSGPVPDDSLDLKFRDTWRIALGANYRASEKWTLRGGIAWDQSPVRDAEHRPTSLPDNDRYWVSVGARYNFSERASIDVGYAHLFVKDTDINNNAGPSKGTVRGDYSSNANIVGVQVSYRF
ncbi:porin [Allopusillimonas soli]|uniref:OmpP1/FadL family transporter n=1 Tax=Allopusillimonas soli TaxID=659016 RepID=UPI001020119E|nr:outer membrane protein transport protein [Allopusillimonas soli]TEA74794.1 porin [Allopusillimonas soli]